MPNRDPSESASSNGLGRVGEDVALGSPPEVDLPRIRRAVREILIAARVARMYAEVFAGLHQDPRVHLKKHFTQKYDEMVLIKDIQFESFCEHHLLPFSGKAHVAYLPNGRVIGLSKIPRVIDVLAKRP